jgi:hypothetical protein
MHGELCLIEKLEKENRSLKEVIDALMTATTLTPERDGGDKWEDLPAFLASVMETESFNDAFCRGCDCITRRERTWVVPEEEECPVLFDFSDVRCCRSKRYREIVSALAEIGRIMEVTP